MKQKWSSSGPIVQDVMVGILPDGQLRVDVTLSRPAQNKAKSFHVSVVAGKNARPESVPIKFQPGESSRYIYLQPRQSQFYIEVSANVRGWIFKNMRVVYRVRLGLYALTDL